MNDIFDLTRLVFEWDGNKDKLNFNKHGVHFATAAKALLDPKMIVREDVSHSTELRFNALARANKVLFIVFTIKEDETVRIISARYADSCEKRRYEINED